jgi:UTP--glucose-1-phosphate uridylyltransferase
VKDLAVPPHLAETLQRYHFDRIPFEALRARLRNTTDPEGLHRIAAGVLPPPEGCVRRVPEPGSEDEGTFRAAGAAGIARGELAAVVLTGGMATRFGSVVKALAPVDEEGRVSFLELKLGDLARYNGVVSTTLMSSFATHDALVQALAARSVPWADLAPQFVSLRVTPEGETFLGEDGAPSPYAPGHGDLPDALAVAGVLRRLRERGVKTVLVSNVDNVGATVDPVLYGMHRASGARISVELVEKLPGDRGGLPVLVAGRLVLAEAFRLPRDFPQDAFPLFNTNTLWLDLEALEAPGVWTWCVARKSVDGRPAVQFERLVGELTWWHDTHWMHVPRVGAASRFLPVKDLADLARYRPELRAVSDARIPGVWP